MELIKADSLRFIPLTNNYFFSYMEVLKWQRRKQKRQQRRKWQRKRQLRKRKRPKRKNDPLIISNRRKAVTANALTAFIFNILTGMPAGNTEIMEGKRPSKFEK